MISSREALLVHQTGTYKGYLVDLPCIVESHKTLDGKQFIKIADICKALIFQDSTPALTNTAAVPQTLTNTAAEINYPSGITPPMAYARERRFRRRLIKAPIIEEIERAVARLLEKDKEALRVDIQVMNKGSSSNPEEEEDVSSLAAEIEQHMLQHTEIEEADGGALSNTAPQTALLSDTAGERAQKEGHLRELLIRLQEKKRQTESISNPILRKRLLEGIEQMEQERDALEAELKELAERK